MSNKHLSNFNIRVDDNFGGSGMHLGQGMDSSMQITPRKNENNTEMKLLNLDQLAVNNKGVIATGMVNNKLLSNILKKSTSIGSSNKTQNSYVDILKIEKFQTFLRSLLKVESVFEYILKFLE